MMGKISWPPGALKGKNDLMAHVTFAGVKILLASLRDLLSEKGGELGM